MFKSILEKKSSRKDRITMRKWIARKKRMKWIISSTIAAMLVGILSYVDTHYNESSESVVYAQLLKEDNVFLQNNRKYNKYSQVDEFHDVHTIKELNQEKPKPEKSLPVVTLEEKLVHYIPKGQVAITFDDGPSKYTEQIVDILKEYQVGGTFFYIGQNVQYYPEAVAYAHENNIAIGSHTLNHDNLAKLGYVGQESQMLRGDELIEQITGEKVELFRPPYGSYNETTNSLVSNYDKKMVLWSVDPRDWDGLSANQIVSFIKGSHNDGSIILLHESQETVDALPRIIEFLQGQGLEIVSLK